MSELLAAGRKFWLTAMLEAYFAIIFALGCLDAGQYTALALPVFFAYLGVNLAQKFTTPEVKP